MADLPKFKISDTNLLLKPV